jgi:hypothetical protein
VGRYKYKVTVDGVDAPDYAAPDPHDPREAWRIGELVGIVARPTRLADYHLIDQGEYAGKLELLTPGRYAERKLSAAFAQAVSTRQPVEVLVADHEPLTKTQLVDVAQHLRNTEPRLAAAIEMGDGLIRLRPDNVP